MTFRCFDERFSNGEVFRADSVAELLKAKDSEFRARAEEVCELTCEALEDFDPEAEAEADFDVDEIYTQLRDEYLAVLEVEHGDEWIPAKLAEYYASIAPKPATRAEPELAWEGM